MTPNIHCSYDGLINPEKLIPHPKNPNKHPNEQMRRLIEYIKFTGWRHAVIVSNQSVAITLQRYLDVTGTQPRKM